LCAHSTAKLFHCSAEVGQIVNKADDSVVVEEDDDFLSFRPNYAKKPGTNNVGWNATPQQQGTSTRIEQLPLAQPGQHKRVTYDRDFVMSFKATCVSNFSIALCVL
jgi:hypothetical protein